jgi:hypothetical protein
MNIILFGTGNSLSLKAMAGLLFKSMVSPPVGSFNPEYYIKQWLG